MDIEKEREAFEEVFPCSTGTVLNEYGHYESQVNQQDAMIQNISWVVWRAAKAQAVPEGFVVLKTSDVREVLSNASDAMDAESPSSVFTQTGNPSTWYDHHLVAEKNILDAIKAQEPAND